jgi:FAD/FMN-containing dehydrogenase
MSTTAQTVAAAAGAVLLPGDPGWDNARFGFNLLNDQQPAAVAFPVDEADVAAAVAFAVREGLRVAPQATGHNQGALGDLEETLLLNVSRLQEVRIDPGARQVRVGAGVKWERVAPRLSAHGLAGLHGSSPDVGIAGYSLGGGIGWLSRKHGMQANAVTAIELVTGDGRLLRADGEQHADLFWALRGGGGNFGVVTALEFAVQPVEELYAGALFYPFERAGEVLHAWSGMLPGLPEELMSWASLLHFPPLPDVPPFARGRSFAVVMAAFLGGEAEGRSLLRPLRELGPARDTFALVPPVVLGDLAMDPLDPLPFQLGHQLLEALPPLTIDALLAAVGPGSGRGETLTMLQLRHMGGALARTTPGAGARATLPGEFSMLALGVVPDEHALDDVQAAVADAEAAVLSQRAGHYANFVEQPAEGLGFFEADAWAQLRAVKASYDGDDLFTGNFHIPPAE